ncbi:uvrC [Acrasis kona]|uniref:UvrC n=1 Tax=Acrasis kona TaxID=1008807 RepID=A0AAW2Z563_9EUKA
MKSPHLTVPDRQPFYMRRPQGRELTASPSPHDSYCTKESIKLKPLRSIKLLTPPETYEVQCYTRARRSAGHSRECSPSPLRPPLVSCPKVFGFDVPASKQLFVCPPTPLEQMEYEHSSCCFGFSCSPMDEYGSMSCTFISTSVTGTVPEHTDNAPLLVLFSLIEMLYGVEKKLVLRRH